MGKFTDWLGFTGGMTHQDSLDQILGKYDVVDFADGKYPVVVPKGMGGELGASSVSPYTDGIRSEHNYTLKGKSGLEMYNKMRKVDGTVGGMLELLKAPVIAARWFVDPYDNTAASKKIADFVEHNLMRGMTITWNQVLYESLLCLEFGYYAFEKVWDVVEEHPVTGKRQVILKKLAPRHPLDIDEVKYDDKGGPKGIVMRVGEDYKETFIDISKLVIISNKRESGNVQGISVLRNAYRDYYYKDVMLKIDAIQKERHGIGIPVIKLPAGYTEADKRLANELGRNLRTNERAHVVLPPFWEIIFAQIGGNPVNAIESVKYHDEQMRESVLAGFLGSDSTTKEEDISIFLKARRMVANNICDAINTHVIPEMVKYNFDSNKLPIIRVRRIGEQSDWRTFSFALRNMIGANVIRPDDRLEEYVREELDLPKTEPDTTRIVTAPQAGIAVAPPGKAQAGTSAPGTAQQVPGTPQPPTPPEVGMPRQTPLPTVGVGNKRTGIDNGKG